MAVTAGNTVVFVDFVVFVVVVFIVVVFIVVVFIVVVFIVEQYSQRGRTSDF